MGYRLAHKRFESANTSEDRTVVYVEYYILDSPDDFLPFFFFHQPNKGSTRVITQRQGSVPVHYYFEVESVSYERKPPRADGTLHVVASTTLKQFEERDDLTPPWELPPYDFSIGSAQTESSVARFYPCEGDPLFPAGSNEPVPFINTAGVSLEAVVSKGFSQISFSYNVPASDFDPNVTWASVGVTNDSPVTICGISFPVRTLVITKYGATFCTSKATTTDANGIETEINWKYYKISVSFDCNPETYNEFYLNAGTHVRRWNPATGGGALYRVWRWTNAAGSPTFGTYWDYIQSGAEDGEAVTESMFLTADGTNVSPLDATGRQIPTYRLGTSYRPVNFNSLNFPSAPPRDWNVAAGNE